MLAGSVTVPWGPAGKQESRPVQRVLGGDICHSRGSQGRGRHGRVSAGGRTVGPTEGLPRWCALSTWWPQTQGRITRPDGRQRTVREALGASEVRGSVCAGGCGPCPAQESSWVGSSPRVPRGERAGQQECGRPGGPWSSRTEGGTRGAKAAPSGGRGTQPSGPPAPILHAASPPSTCPRGCTCGCRVPRPAATPYPGLLRCARSLCSPRAGAPPSGMV